ncbi:hypothetical protein IVA79_08080 [Bradyrhizobium sp. 138]|uniref:hypothetical protein n=1 Tax=Bradyrhizobium sp. 138 TaxID=2782615 RepID=UPI001FFB8B92|nr:hypothetical protein [Bradyrhizobium sp. 138]MCK1733913.1 hypothetical protein [Bradyrhizobium sp. 138]
MDNMLERHMAVVGRVTAKFVSTGLMTHNIDSRAVERFLGVAEDKQVFEAVIRWMLDEGIIRAKNVSQTMDGTVYVAAAQLTAKGLSIVKQQLAGGDSVEKQIREADAGGGSSWSSIGDLIGGIAGGLIKSVSSG